MPVGPVYVRTVADNFMDKAKGLADKAKELVHEHEDKVDGALDKVGDLIDQKTGGKHSSTIDTAVAKAKEATDKVGAEGSKLAGAPKSKPAGKQVIRPKDLEPGGLAAKKPKKAKPAGSGPDLTGPR